MYMAINTRKEIKPSVSEDIESLIYTCMLLAGIKLKMGEFRCLWFL